MIVRILSHLRENGVTDVVLNLHHRPETLTGLLGDGTALGVRVRYSWEQPRILGSAGGPRHALPLFGAWLPSGADGPLLIVNGDTLTTVDVAALEQRHRTSGALVTLALVPNTDFLHYGGVQLDRDHRVIGFVPRGPAAEGTFHYIGLQIAERSVFADLVDGEPASSIGGVYDRLIATAPGSVVGSVSESAFWDVGTVDDYWRMSDAFAAREQRGDVVRGRAGSIHPTARIAHSILWDDVAVGAGASVEHCIITDGAHIPAGAVLHDAIVVSDGTTHR